MMPIFSEADTFDMSWYPASALPNTLAHTATRHPWYAHPFDWIVEARSHRVILLVLCVWLLNGFDLVFTILAYEQGMLHEENPLARQMLQNGIPSIVLFKIGLVLIGSYPLLRFRTARITELGTLVILVAYALLAVHWSECYGYYTMTITESPNIAELGQVRMLTLP